MVPGELGRLLERAMEAFSKAQYNVEEIDFPPGGRSVDIVASKSDRRVFVKIAYDASRITSRELADMKKLSASYNAAAIIVAEKHRKRKLEEDTVHVRSDLFVVSGELLERYLLYNDKPLVMNIRGAYVVKIDGSKFAQRRMELGLSRGEIAEKLNVSREAVYQYEAGHSMATIRVALKIAEIMGEDVIKEIDILGSETLDVPSDDPSSGIGQKLRQALAGKSIKIYQLSAAPIDFAVKGPKKTAAVVDVAGCDGAVAEAKVLNAEKIIKITRSLPVVVDRAENIEQRLRELREEL